ncbi:HAMP domain-containing sensor histidine kinase [Bradyrhizobium sp. CB2312]|uniref:sensor histidine kinase n=1 Tax=Bradyrhizobium sp. CB2312 TaxID=3039155 RepID=UPI0024B23993|nr:HAMP domain-containing sensor histidine kinase [Bradyrhizobium sp. CB2312]WFU73409.1 HAMP domain-containing sensor histidine kinase [Bradyrhizobium sp. CB2312]
MRTIESFVATPNRLDRNARGLIAQEFQTTIIGILGHDLRDSLQVIQSTYALLRSRFEQMPQQAWLDRGERAATKLTEQLNCLVDAFYLAERENALEVGPVGLGPLFWQLRYEQEDAAIQRGIDLRAVAGNIDVASNPVLLGCVLRNLLTNAIRYTEPGGRILIGCRRRGPEIRIDVYDTGIGIPEHQLPRIFEPFTRLAPGRGNGLGIGLSIVRRALEVLGHRIEVRSIEGRGSLFSIYAPAVPPGAR